MEPEKPKLRKKRRSKKSIKQPSTEISIDGNLTDLIDEFSKPTFIEPDTQDIMSGETMELLVEAIKTANHEPLIVQPTNESVNSTVEQMKKDLAEVTELTDGTAWSDVEDVPRDRDEHRTKSRRNTKDSSKRRTRKKGFSFSIFLVGLGYGFCEKIGIPSLEERHLLLTAVEIFADSPRLHFTVKARTRRNTLLGSP